MATWPSAGKGLPLQGNVFAVTGGSSGKAVHGLWRHGQALAQGCRCRATCVRWPGKAAAKQAHRRVLCRDGRCFAHVLKPSTWSMATWPGAGKGLPLQGNVCAVTWEGSGKAVKAHRRILCRDGPCFAHVLKPSKWSMATWPGAGKGLPLQGNVFAVTWEGSGKAVKAHTGVLCPDGPCFAQVVKPSKWMEWSMAIWQRGQALAKGCRCRATCSRWPGEAVARRYMDYGDMARHWHRAAAAGQRVCGDLGRQRQSGKGRQTGFVSWWAVLRTRFETL